MKIQVKPLIFRWLSNMSLRAKGFIVVSIPLGAMLLSFVLSYLINLEQDRAENLMQCSMQVRSELDRLLDQVGDAQRGVRSYLFNQNEEFLEPYHFAKQTLPSSLSELFKLAKDNPSQTARLRGIQSLVNDQVSLLATLVGNPSTGTSDSAPADRTIGMAKTSHQMDKLRQEIGSLDAEQQRLQTVRTAQLQRVERWRSITDIGEVFVGLLGAFVAVLLFSKGIISRVRHVQTNADRLAEGLPLLASAAAADEIGELAQHLEAAGALLLERSRALEESLAREQQARGDAERASQAKSQFLSRTSHELRTPLNAILGFGQILEISQLPAQEMQCVHYILKGGRYLLTLVDEVLDLAKVESGQLGLKLSAVSFDSLSRECIAFVERLAEARAITCTLEESPAFQVPVWADKHRLRQVLLNLLSNAIKYNREGGQVMLSCEQTPEGYVRLKVSDTGHGISAEDLARLFMPFERLEQEYGEVEGTGLGLVVSQQIAEAMGGCLGLESQVNEGTTFWIELPGVKAALAESAVTAPLKLPTTVKEEVASAAVLYIEDNPSNLQVVQMIVARLRPQWRFLSARDGYNGLLLAREHLPGCILLDMQLPGLNGDEILAELRAHAATRDIPVLLVSADVMTYNREAMLAMGASGYLPKPFEVSDLLGKLDGYLLERAELALSGDG